MTAYYNEIDPKAAAWLRELIAGGHIADGVVDERDIRDIRPDEIAGYARAISSPASAGGPSRCDSPDGQTTGRCGQAPALASLSARQASEAGLLTSGTSGRTGSTSSISAALQSCLESRLRARTDSDGLTLYRLTWKARATPSGRLICALRASARPISDSGSGSERSGWITPGASDGSGGGQASRVGGPHSQQLNDQVMLAGWNTPRATDGSNGGPGQAGGALPADAALAGWPTATTRDWKDGGNPDVNVPLNALLGRVAWLAGWPTQDRPARVTASGEMRTGFSAGMESGGRLNPEHSRWIMGYPAALGSCGATAMQSFHRSRLSLSARLRTPC